LFIGGSTESSQLAPRHDVEGVFEVDEIDLVLFGGQDIDFLFFL
jgi:hypothetical protein